MNKAAAFIHSPLSFEHKFNIYPPTVRQVIENREFHMYYRALTTTQEDIEEELTNDKNFDKQLPTPLEFLLINCYNSPQFKKIVVKAFEFFVHDTVNILYERKMLVIGKVEDIVQGITSLEDLSAITEENYFDFQNAIRTACGYSQEKPPEVLDPDEDPRVTAIKLKARRRERIKKKKGSPDGITLETSLVAICCMGLGINPLNIGEMSYAAIGPLMNIYQDKEKYMIDVKSILAGADSKKIKPKYWIRNSDKE